MATSWAGEQSAVGPRAASVGACAAPRRASVAARFLGPRLPARRPLTPLYARWPARRRAAPAGLAHDAAMLLANPPARAGPARAAGAGRRAGARRRPTARSCATWRPGLPWRATAGRPAVGRRRLPPRRAWRWLLATPRGRTLDLFAHNKRCFATEVYVYALSLQPGSLVITGTAGKKTTVHERCVPQAVQFVLLPVLERGAVRARAWPTRSRAAPPSPARPPPFPPGAAWPRWPRWPNKVRRRPKPSPTDCAEVPETGVGRGGRPEEAAARRVAAPQHWLSDSRAPPAKRVVPGCPLYRVRAVAQAQQYRGERQAEEPAEYAPYYGAGPEDSSRRSARAAGAAVADTGSPSPTPTQR
uniref:Uncharacterized protein n=1 Tax=Heliothis virescens TaxID=7102 RepID=A0A2A4JVX4_HELVI